MADSSIGTSFPGITDLHLTRPEAVARVKTRLEGIVWPVSIVQFASRAHRYQIALRLLLIASKFPRIRAPLLILLLISRAPRLARLSGSSKFPSIFIYNARGLSLTPSYSSFSAHAGILEIPRSGFFSFSV